MSYTAYGFARVVAYKLLPCLLFVNMAMSVSMCLFNPLNSLSISSGRTGVGVASFLFMLVHGLVIVYFVLANHLSSDIQLKSTRNGIPIHSSIDWLHTYSSWMASQ
jgi:hypothetical protein